jgi:ADP-ribose pyrophosphatase YjhB (NUDIX family)
VSDNSYGNLTVGVFILNVYNELLVCHPNEVKSDIWGIPKGRPNAGELLKMTAIREVHEETGIDLLPYAGQLVYIGSEPYKHKVKTLSAFTVTMGNAIPESELHCISNFESRYSGEMIPEIDAYKWVNFDDFQHKIQREQVALWERHLKALDIGH